MTSSKNQLFQAIGILLQGINVSVFPHEYQLTLALIVAVLQAVVGVIAHQYTPNGEKL